MPLFFLRFTIHQLWPAGGLWFLFLRVFWGVCVREVISFSPPSWFQKPSLLTECRHAGLAHSQPAVLVSQGKRVQLEKKLVRHVQPALGLVMKSLPACSSSSTFLHSCVKCCLGLVVYTSVFLLLETVLPIPAVISCCARCHHESLLSPSTPWFSLISFRPERARGL